MLLLFTEDLADKTIDNLIDCYKIFVSYIMDLKFKKSWKVSGLRVLSRVPAHSGAEVRGVILEVLQNWFQADLTIQRGTCAWNSK